MRCLLVGCMFFLSSWCYAQEDSVTYQLILLGGAGESKSAENSQYIASLTKQFNSSSAFIFLGDNANPKGLPGSEDKHRKTAEQSLLNQIGMISPNAEAYFIPGNRDWKNGKHEGLGYVMNQQRYFDSLKNSKIHFLPRDGCPGPDEIR